MDKNKRQGLTSSIQSDIEGVCSQAVGDLAPVRAVVLIGRHVVDDEYAFLLVPALRADRALQLVSTRVQQLAALKTKQLICKDQPCACKAGMLCIPRAVIPTK